MQRSQSERHKILTPFGRTPQNRGTVVRRASETNPMTEKEIKNVIEVYTEANKAYYEHQMKKKKVEKKKKKKNPFKNISKNSTKIVTSTSSLNTSPTVTNTVTNNFTNCIAQKSSMKSSKNSTKGGKKKKAKNEAQQATKDAMLRKQEAMKFDPYSLDPLKYRNEIFEENGRLLHLPGFDIDPSYIPAHPQTPYGVSSLSYKTLHTSNPAAWGNAYTNHYELPTICSIVKSKHPIYAKSNNSKQNKGVLKKKQNKSKTNAATQRNMNNLTVKKIPTFGIEQDNDFANYSENTINDSNDDKSGRNNKMENEWLKNNGDETPSVTKMEAENANASDANDAYNDQRKRNDSMLVQVHSDMQSIHMCSSISADGSLMNSSVNILEFKNYNMDSPSMNAPHFVSNYDSGSFRKGLDDNVFDETPPPGSVHKNYCTSADKNAYCGKDFTLGDSENTLPGRYTPTRENRGEEGDKYNKTENSVLSDFQNKNIYQQYLQNNSLQKEKQILHTQHNSNEIHMKHQVQSPSVVSGEVHYSNVTCNTIPMPAINSHLDKNEENIIYTSGSPTFNGSNSIFSLGPNNVAVTSLNCAYNPGSKTVQTNATGNNVDTIHNEFHLPMSVNTANTTAHVIHTDVTNTHINDVRISPTKHTVSQNTMSYIHTNAPVEMTKTQHPGNVVIVNPNTHMCSVPNTPHMHNVVHPTPSEIQVHSEVLTDCPQAHIQPKLEDAQEHMNKLHMQINQLQSEIQKVQSRVSQGNVSSSPANTSLPQNVAMGPVDEMNKQMHLKQTFTPYTNNCRNNLCNTLNQPFYNMNNGAYMEQTKNNRVETTRDVNVMTNVTKVNNTNIDATSEIQVNATGSGISYRNPNTSNPSWTNNFNNANISAAGNGLVNTSYAYAPPNGNIQQENYTTQGMTVAQTRNTNAQNFNAIPNIINGTTVRNITNTAQGNNVYVSNSAQIEHTKLNMGPMNIADIIKSSNEHLVNLENKRLQSILDGDVTYKNENYVNTNGLACFNYAANTAQVVESVLHNKPAALQIDKINTTYMNNSTVIKPPCNPINNGAGPVTINRQHITNTNNVAGAGGATFTVHQEQKREAVNMNEMSSVMNTNILGNNANSVNNVNNKIHLNYLTPPL